MPRRKAQVISLDEFLTDKPIRPIAQPLDKSLWDKIVVQSWDENVSVTLLWANYECSCGATYTAPQHYTPCFLKTRKANKSGRVPIYTIKPITDMLSAYGNLPIELDLMTVKITTCPLCMGNVLGHTDQLQLDLAIPYHIEHNLYWVEFPKDRTQIHYTQEERVEIREARRQEKENA